jgi:mannan endo-1,4-beta-mannosidase
MPVMRTARSLAIVVLATWNLSLWYPPAGAPAAPGFVSRRGDTLLLQGRPLRFVGVNCYRLVEYADRYDEIFSTLSAHGIRAVRFWAFQSFCGPDGRDFSRFHQLIAAAARHDILVVPVIDNHWGHCTHAPADRVKPAAWYEAGWRDEPFGGAALSYRDYLRALGREFRDEPRILFWQLVNEPEIWPASRENFVRLREFARQASRELKQAAPRHLVSLGLLGIGQPSTEHRRFRALQNFEGIDLVTAHDHGYMNEPLPGRAQRPHTNSFYANLREARSLGKPFLATETGIALSWVKGDRQRRADLYRAKLRAFFAAGGAGYFVWNYQPPPPADDGQQPDPELDYCGGLSHRFSPDHDYGFGPDDPLMEALAEMARELD